MSFSLLLIGFSLALLAYWFRYSCLLILHTQTAENYSEAVCRANGLSFDLVKGHIEAGQSPDLASLYKTLERDYAVVNQLLDQVAGQEILLETKLLRLNFKMTQAWFRVSQSLGLKAPVAALEEMADTIAHFANSFGEIQKASGASA